MPAIRRLPIRRGAGPTNAPIAYVPIHRVGLLQKRIGPMDRPAANVPGIAKLCDKRRCDTKRDFKIQRNEPGLTA